MRRNTAYRREEFHQPFDEHGIDVITSHVDQLEDIETLHAMRVPYGMGLLSAWPRI